MDCDTAEVGFGTADKPDTDFDVAGMDFDAVCQRVDAADKSDIGFDTAYMVFGAANLGFDAAGVDFDTAGVDFDVAAVDFDAVGTNLGFAFSIRSHAAILRSCSMNHLSNSSELMLAFFAAKFASNSRFIYTDATCDFSECQESTL